MTNSVRARLLGAASLLAVCPLMAQAQASMPQSQDPAVQTQLTPTPTDSSPANSAFVEEAQSAAGQADAESSDIVVTGIRASQRRAVNIKREAASVTDSISAEDIGKLPDVTISDSLQRIPGVQIRRSAGEGANVNIRGLPQVTTLMNGEAFLGANSITNIQPNFNDIPSQLFAGADVIKATTADQLNAGITGTVNLRTRRPMDLKRGLTFAAAAEGAYGDKSKNKFDPNFNGLLSYHGDQFGILVSAAYSNVRLYNASNGILRDYGATYHDEGTYDAKSSGGFSPANRPRGTPVTGGVDINGDGDAKDVFIVSEGFNGFEKTNQRKRLGLNGSLQFEISDALTLTGDAFYTKQQEYGRTAGFQMSAINWQAGEFQPGVSRNTGVQVRRRTGSGANDFALFDLNTIQRYDYDLGGFDSYSQLDHYDSQSQNYNAELKWDKGGPFKATLRGVYGKASQAYDQSYLQFSLNNGRQWNNGIGHYPDGDIAFNPNGYTVSTIAGLSSLPASVNFSGNKPVFTLPQQLVAELGDIQNYALKTVASENNYRRGSDQKIVRLDTSYTASDALNFAFGGRYSDRSASNSQFDRAAPLYAGQGASNAAGCLVKWKAFDVPLNNTSTCSAGNAGGFFTAGHTRKANDSSFNGAVKLFDPQVAGVPSMYVLDPKAMDDVVAFQNSLYPGNIEVAVPGSSYTVGVKQISGYAEMNVKGEVFGIPVTGNAGVKVIDTRLNIVQGVTGSPQSYGLPNLPNGTVQTRRGFTDILPAFNLAFDFASNLKLRFAFAKTMTLLDLNQWGGGLTPNYAIDTSGATPIFRVTGGSQAGNPELDPWRATNVEGSLEWYLGRGSLVSVGAFYIAVDSFIQAGNVQRTDLPDNDGVVRGRTVSVSTPIQGEGGALKGVEAGAKLSFGDIGFLSNGFLSNFGIDANATFSPSDSGQTDLAGKAIPFQDNSKYQYNAALYYQDAKFQARVAWNYRSKRAVQSDFGGLTGLEVYQAPTSYVDASVSYDITPNFTIYGQGSNLTGEYERYYLTWKDERAYNNIFERRFTAGARVKF
ncbi:TonB-dependent receptor [Sphingomonas sp. 1P08PE]|uniref:TonB-dependent receptor n=1 Tax=Sphingomonas sp. 1P08PE TaxID=554122 RepID=UPI0039A36421